MKRHGNLWDRLVSFENLFEAAAKASRGKRLRAPVLRFHFDIEREVPRLRDELSSKTYRPGPYRAFRIYEPKERLISAAPYRDRVVHHALVSVLEPIFEKTFVFDSYACRKRKGTHAAVDRAQCYARRFPYVLKADVKKFFPSVDHEILKGLVARKIKDPDVLWLVGLVVDNSNPQEPVADWFPGDELFSPSERRRGLPIGNQTSQFFANVVLDRLDHFVKERLGAKGYVRYVDDFLVFADDKAFLARAQSEIGKFLAGLRLRLHPRKNVFFPVARGIPFLGYRVLPTHRLLQKANVKRFRRRLARMQREVAEGRLELPKIRLRIASWIGHAKQADTYLLRRRLLSGVTFRRAAAPA
jgi:retron-type reverse transcriptase